QLKQCQPSLRRIFFSGIHPTFRQPPLSKHLATVGRKKFPLTGRSLQQNPAQPLKKAKNGLFTNGETATQRRDEVTDKQHTWLALCTARNNNKTFSVELKSYGGTNTSGQTDPGGECSQEAEDARPTTSGDESHTCDQCERTFATKSRLTVHKRIHADVKLYRCDECGTSFCRSSSLKRHRLLHSGIKPHVCDECGLAFTWLPSLRKHQLSHSGSKTFCCDLLKNRELGGS
uniref:C2H2-type domain-containing protein n=1 Tax=Haplochromis burtoni TaxID=8153 RepID=A0A3Q2VZT8_HAPBU